jgi:glyceraldehyde-3-phosphate dehydrogenase/erythrose-4-phosphate dehydrogenase
MVQKKEYKNNSYVIRDALVRLMDEKDGAVGEVGTESSPTTDLSLILPHISATLVITIPANNLKIEHKLNKLESENQRTIIHKSSCNYNKLNTILYVLQDSMDIIQGFITTVNGMEELKSFRYVINDIEEAE